MAKPGTVSHALAHGYDPMKCSCGEPVAQGSDGSFLPWCNTCEKKLLRRHGDAHQQLAAAVGLQRATEKTVASARPLRRIAALGTSRN